MSKDTPHGYSAGSRLDGPHDPNGWTSATRRDEAPPFSQAEADRRAKAYADRKGGAK